MRTRLKPNFHTIDTRYKLLVIDLIFIATIDKKKSSNGVISERIDQMGTSRERTTRDDEV